MHTSVQKVPAPLLAVAFYIIRCCNQITLSPQFYGLHQTIARACLQGGGRPQVGEVTCGGSPHLSCKRDQIKIGDYMDRRVTPPKWVTTPTWGPPLHVNRPLVDETG